MLCLTLFLPLVGVAQHQNTLRVVLNDAEKIFDVSQQLIFYNDSPDTLQSIVLNDWNNAYSTKNTPLARRFSDEFVRNFQIAKEEERGHTTITSVQSEETKLLWNRPEGFPDLVEIQLAEPLLPGQKTTVNLDYQLKIPSNKFTKYGYGNPGEYNLKHWILSAARYENGNFIRYSNYNIDDIANAISDYNLTLEIPKHIEVESDLDILKITDNQETKSYYLNGDHRLDFALFLNPKSPFLSFKNDIVDVRNGLSDSKVNDISKAIIVDRIVHFVNDNIGTYPYNTITVSQTDYDRNPFYGLNQLPSFINVFQEDFQYELKFLKTYLNNFLKNTVALDQRKDNWIFDGIQVYMMMQYIEENHPQMKMAGGLSRLGILKSYHFANVDFNGQYSYFYMLMARKNLDQPVGDPKNTFIKFNEQIAGKYYAGLSLKYLNSYLENDIVKNSIKDFFIASDKQVNESDFQRILKGKTDRNTDWFFNTIIHTRDAVDYKFTDLHKTEDRITVTLKNITGTAVPIPVYGLQKGQVVFKEWITGVATDSVIVFPRKGADKIVLNYKNEVPEINLRNNWKTLKRFGISNRPLKFAFFKDLEDPYYNQILYVPTVVYNLYDGIMPGMRLYNKTILDKPFTYDINPSYSINTKSLTGSFSFSYNDLSRNSKLYSTRYAIGGNYFHYAADAAYLNITPTVQFRFRENDFRDNRKQIITLRNVLVHRENNDFDVNSKSQDYSVFNARYTNANSEVTDQTIFTTDFQASGKFGKASGEFQFRKLFDNNRQINLRFYAGAFLYNKTDSDFFSFALDRPTDYLFDYNYYGRSETSGLFSQQLILAEGGFKSKLNMPYASQWITTANVGFTVWNWIELYGDAGIVKSRFSSEKFVFDSGVRLNLVQDYFELYFPIVSTNGWEVAQDNYSQKIRFIVTLSPSTLINLFTRKWL